MTGATIILDRSGSSPIFKLVGEFSKESSETLRHTVSGIFPEEDSVITLDCSELEYMDSSSLGVIAYLHIHLQNRGRRLEISNPSSLVQEILETSGIGNLISIVITDRD